MPRAADIIADRFVIERKVGSGGMGSVYRATDRRTGEVVALKMMLGGGGGGDVERFAAEIEALSALDHPGIVRLVAHGTTAQDEPFLAMEWLDGEDLTERIGRGGLGASEAVVVGQRVAEALAAAHAKGFVHRDIKPSNIFLQDGDPERVKLLDFGIARLGAAGRERLTASGVIMGTPGYMSPEQARGTRDIDARTDIFALGAVLFECFAGRPAFAGEHPMAVLAKLLLEEAPRLGEIRADLPEELVDLVARMLAKDPDARPDDAGEIAAELAAIAEAIAEAIAAGDTEAQATEGGSSARRARQTRAPGPRPRALTIGEQRLVSVIVARIAADDALETGEQPQPDVASERGGALTLVASAGSSTNERLRAALAPFGARVDALLDGSVIAVMSGAGSATDQAARAARASLALQRIAPRAAIAVVTGLGEISGPLPVGQVLDRAAALLPPGAAASVRIDAVTRGLLDVRFETVSGPGGIELLGEGEIGDGARTLLGRPSICVGRDRELRTLGDVLDECVNESVARPVLVTAPAGMGKSRVRHEMVREAKQRFPEVDVWIARCDPISAGSALGVVASAIRTTAGVIVGEPREARLQKLADRVARHVPERDRARVTEILGDVIGAPIDDASASALLVSARASASVMAEQTRRAFEDFAAAECASHPVLLVIEDLHWGDAPSVGLIDATLRKLRDKPFMVLALGRPEVHDLFPKIWSERDRLEIRLGELTRRAAERLVRHALGASIPAEHVARVVERAAGNAFYLEELIHAVAEGTPMPETVLAMVQARIDALPASSRRALRAASIFGETFWKGGVFALLGGADRTTLSSEWLDELCEREIIDRRAESRIEGEEELQFRHALLRDGAYAMLTEADRALGHRLAAEWLERAGEVDSIVLAEHFERGGEGARAAIYGMRAAERMLSANDLRAAVARAERGLQHIESDEHRFRLMRVLGESKWYLGDFSGSERCADELLAQSVPGSEPWCSALSAKLVSGIQLGRMESVQAGMAMFEGAQATPENARPMCRIAGLVAGVLVGVGQYATACAYYERADRVGEMIEARDAAGIGMWQLGRANQLLTFGADPWAALGAALRAIAGYEAAGEVRFEMYARVAAVTAYRALGLFDRAEEQCRRVMAFEDASGHTALVGRAALVTIYAERGAITQAIDEGGGALESAIALKDKLREGIVRAALALARRQRGELEIADAEAKAAVDLLKKRPFMQLDALAVLALVRLDQGRAAEAIELATRVLSPDEPSPPHPPGEPLARLVLAEALALSGDRDAARRALAAARDRLSAIASRIGDDHARRAFLEAIAPNASALALAASDPGA